MLLTVFQLTAFETGQASWYGGKFQGRKTANGEIFDTNKLTAAHKTLPFGTVVNVTNLKNDLQVEVRINDRGPFVGGRVIDLSRAAADAIDMTLSGIGLVKVEIVSLPEGVNKSSVRLSADVHPEGIPDSYKIQIASFSKANNAQLCLDKIKKAGLEADLELSASGMIRVIVPAVREEDLESVKTRLIQLGFSSPLVRHN